VIDEKLLVKSKPYRDLYMGYLGTLKVLGELASRTDPAERCMEDEIVACKEDAREFLAPRVKIITYEHSGFYLENTL